jgi:adiponectin receptor
MSTHHFQVDNAESSSTANDDSLVHRQSVSQPGLDTELSAELKPTQTLADGLVEEDNQLTMAIPARSRFRRFSMPTRPASFAANETLTSYFEAIHDHLPPSMSITLGNLRNALLGYLSEAESVVRERLVGDVAEDSDSMPVSERSSTTDETVISQTGAEPGITGLGLRRRGAALQRRLSGGIQAPAFPTPESLLAHLAAIREDVAASLPEMSYITSIQTPSLPIPSMASFLQTLPNRLYYLQEHLPATGQPDKERVARLVRSLLPSEDWAGWERLGWDAGDDDGDSIIPASEDEEPEYLFPNKTPKAAMKRLESYAARTKSRSASLSAAALRMSRSMTELRLAGGADLGGEVEIAAGDDEEEKEEEELLLITKKIQLGVQVGPTTQETLQKSQYGKVLITYDDLPPWMQNNEFLVTGYR